MWKEFKEFAFRGNVIELAVAVILGLAFGVVITSLVNDVLMNLIAAAIGQPDFSQLTFTVGDAVIRYGAFLNALVNFLLVALALFLVVKTVNRATRKPADEEPTVRECPYCLTTIPARASRCSACTMEVQPVTLG
jgi:large conductance mechanosensitive channel